MVGLGSTSLDACGEFSAWLSAIVTLGVDSLKWKVEDGWAPLCKYLEKPVPDTEFPSGNNAATFQARIDKMNNARLTEAGRNFLLVLTIIIGLSAWIYMRLLR